MNLKTDDEDKTPGAPPPASDDKGQPRDASEKGEHMIPKSRLDEVIADLNTLKAEKAEREDKDRKAAEAKAKDEGKFNDILAARDTEIADLKRQAERADRLDALLKTHIDAETNTWPDEAKALVADITDAETLAAQVGKARPLAAKLQTVTSAPGNGRTPKPAGGHTDAKSDELAKAADARRFRR